MKDDTISRTAALDFIDSMNWCDEISDEAFKKITIHLENLPSAQPDHIGEVTEMVGDVISRQAAISEIMEDLEDRSLHDDPATPEDYAEGYDEGIRNAAAIVLQMPSAQPGWIPWNSGKFPEESGTYTVTAYDGATKRVTYAKYQKRLKRWELTGARTYWRVLAWMPHIEPWEGGRDA